MASSSFWQRFQRYFLEYPELGFSLDISRMKFPEDLFERMRLQIDVQQLPDGVLNFFVAIVELRNDWRAARFEVEDGITSGDYLQGFLRGTRGALHDNGRESITISIREANTFYVGALIGLYGRAVGVNINAYDQPEVEAGKKAASKLEPVDDRFSLAKLS
jgi:hypothetical protein